LDQWWLSSDGADLYAYLKNLDPNLVINERVKRDFGLGDYAVAEFGTPSAPMNRPWEACQTMNGAWGYDSSKETPQDYQTSQYLIQQLVTIASREGNYLLNIGPDEDGDVTFLSRDRLNGIAAWAGTHIGSIRGTTRSPFPSEPTWGLYTKKDGYLYCHVFAWPGTTLTVPRITNTISRIYMMEDPSVSLNYTLGANITITTPRRAPDANDSVVVIECAGVPVAAPVVFTDGTYILVAKHSGDAAKAVGTTAGSLVQTYAYNKKKPGYKWSVTSIGNGKYSIVNVDSGKPLSIVGESIADGAKADIDNASSSNFQKWTITAVVGGYYKIINDGSGKALDVSAAGTADGSQVIQWPWSGANNQQWQFQTP
jgi:hypothetical protein